MTPPRPSETTNASAFTVTSRCTASGSSSPAAASPAGKFRSITVVWVNTMDSSSTGTSTIMRFMNGVTSRSAAS